MAGEARRFELGAGFQLGSIRGIPIRIHVSFLLVLPLLAFGFARGIVEAARLAGIPAESLSGGPAIWGLLVALALFLSVLLHELAHSLYAIARGGKVRSITLLMIGGVSELEEAPRKPGQEAVMALVGPLTSLGLGAIFLALYLAARGLRSFDLSFALFQLAQMNLLLGAFNLLPAFPMDGGRILRSLLVKRRGPAQATAIAATVGKVFAILFGMAGFLTSNLLLVLVAFFVFMGAEGEQRGAAMEAALGGLRVADLMVPGVDAVSSVETASAVAARMVRDRRAWFPVVEGERARGGDGRDGAGHPSRKVARDPGRRAGDSRHGGGTHRRPGAGPAAARRAPGGAPGGGGGGTAVRRHLPLRHPARGPPSRARGLAASAAGERHLTRASGQRRIRARISSMKGPGSSGVSTTVRSSVRTSTSGARRTA